MSMKFVAHQWSLYYIHSVHTQFEPFQKNALRTSWVLTLFTPRPYWNQTEGIYWSAVHCSAFVHRLKLRFHLFAMWMQMRNVNTTENWKHRISRPIVVLPYIHMFYQTGNPFIHRPPQSSTCQVGGQVHWSPHRIRLSPKLCARGILASLFLPVCLSGMSNNCE